MTFLLFRTAYSIFKYFQSPEEKKFGGGVILPYTSNPEVGNLEVDDISEVNEIPESNGNPEVEDISEVNEINDIPGVNGNPEVEDIPKLDNDVEEMDSIGFGPLPGRGQE